MNRRTFIKRMGQFFGLPVAAAVLPLPIPEATGLTVEKIREAKTVLDAQAVPNISGYVSAIARGIAKREDELILRALELAANPPFVFSEDCTFTAGKIDIDADSEVTIERIDDLS